jgi:hypothetical protein
VRAERLRGGLLSQDGAWLAYYVALDEDPAQNGLWLVRSDGSTRRKLDRDLFGAYQWRDAGRLLVIPFRPEAVSHELGAGREHGGDTPPDGSRRHPLQDCQRRLDRLARWPARGLRREPGPQHLLADANGLGKLNVARERSLRNEG